MAESRSNSSGSTPKRPPAKTPEAREGQIISLAMDLVEKQIREGTASSQVLTHFLKLASPREQDERKKLKADVSLVEAKVESMQSMARSEELFEEAIKAMRSYQGAEDVGPDDD